MASAKEAKSSTARTIAIGAVGGVAAGLLANLARKAAVQAPSALAGNWDKALAAEHAAALKIFDLLEKTTEEDPVKRASLLAQLKHTVGKHAWQEENVIYTMMRDHGLTEASAFSFVQKTAMRDRQTMRVVAQRVLDDELRP